MKGVIIAAGYGTRFLPVTKTVPKEMLPLLDKPSIAFIIEEFIASGIKDIVIVTSRRKKALEDYLDREMELEYVFTEQGAEKKLEKIKPYDASFCFIRQQEMRGTGHAMLQLKPLIGNEPFVVAYPDDLHFGEIPLTKQLIDQYEQTGCTVMATLHSPPSLERYGILSVAEDNLHVTDIVEKPAPGTAPSKEASIGRYVYTPDIFGPLEEGWQNHTGGEYFHTHALKNLMDQNKVVFKQTEGTRLDIGTPEGYLRALIRYASQNENLKKVIRNEMQ